MPPTTDIQWKRVLLCGFFVEVTLFAIVLPLNMVLRPHVTYYSVPLLVFASAVVSAYWVARPLSSRFLLHGALVAVVASITYVTLTTALGTPVPLLFHSSHGLRILGGLLGGKLAAQPGSAA